MLLEKLRPRGPQSEPQPDRLLVGVRPQASHFTFQACFLIDRSSQQRSQ